jgi:hypothetical protein
MTFTYVGDPSLSNVAKVRFLIGDTESTDPHLTDEEITFLITLHGSDIWEASRAAAENIAVSYAHRANYSKTVGDLSISEQFNQSADQFYKLANKIKDQRYRLAPPMPIVNSSSLVSTDDRNVEDYNTDFYVGAHDNPNTSNDVLNYNN